MRNLIKKIKVIAVMSLAILLNSCLEDTGYLDIYNKVNDVPVVSFGQDDHGFVTRTVEVSPTSQDISVNINIARATSDVTITVGVDPTLLVGDYAEYKVLPDSTYTFSSTSITIPKGTLDKAFTFQVVSSKISLTYQYILPLVITTVTEGTVIASNLSTALVSVGVKNAYDGRYEITGGTITRNSATGPDLSLGGTYNAGIILSLATISANSVSIVPVWKDGSLVGGIDGTSLTIDLATNKVTVKSSNATLKNTPTKENSYDPATQTFTLNFDWGTSPDTRIIADWKLKRIGPR